MNSLGLHQSGEGDGSVVGRGDHDPAAQGFEEVPGTGFQKILIGVKILFAWCYMYSIIMP
jgi:hypothetical protein